MTTAQNIFDMADKWNNAGTVFTAVKMNVTDTASQAGSLLIDLQVGGGSRFSVSKGGNIVTPSGVNVNGNQIILSANGNIIASGSVNLGPLNDGILIRDAADTLAQRRATNPQGYRVYGTYTDASNYERGVTSWNSNIFEIGTEAAGTGTARGVRIKVPNQAGIGIQMSTGGLDRWTFAGDGRILANSDNSYDIGASGANRPRNGYFAGHLYADGNLNLLSSAGQINIGNPVDVILTRDAANILALRNGANGQTLNIYNTYTDASNYERTLIGWGGSVFYVNVQNSGTGTLRALALNGSTVALQTSGATRWTVAAGAGADLLASGAATIRSSSTLAFRSNGSAAGWSINLSGHFIAETDNTYSIGSLTNRVRQIFASDAIRLDGGMGIGTAFTGTSRLTLAGATNISAMNVVTSAAPTTPVDGDIWREDNTNTGLKIRVNGVTKTITLS